MKTKSLDPKDNCSYTVNDAASKIAVEQQNACCNCDEPTVCCPPGCCGQ